MTVLQNDLIFATYLSNHPLLLGKPDQETLNILFVQRLIVKNTFESSKSFYFTRLVLTLFLKCLQMAPQSDIMTAHVIECGAPQAISAARGGLSGDRISVWTKVKVNLHAKNQGCRLNSLAFRAQTDRQMDKHTRD